MSTETFVLEKQRPAAADLRPAPIRLLKRFKRWAESKFGWLAFLAQFGLVGLTGMAVDVLSFWALTSFLILDLARALAIAVAMTWNFLLNRRFTFTDARREPFWKQYFLFCASCLVGAIVNWTVSIFLCRGSDWFNDHKVVAALIGVAAGFFFNFILSRRFVFRAEKS
jgi:dolichol-phosphate mannosyltransferase